MRENGLKEVHGSANENEENRVDHTRENGSKQIDAMLATEEALDSIIGSQIVDFNEIVMSDHRGFIVDINKHYFFRLLPSNYDEIQLRMLKPCNRKHRTKFQEKVEEFIKLTKIEEKLTRINNSRVSPKELNAIDDLITCILNSARKSVEGVKSNVPYFNEKNQTQLEIKYLKAVIKQRRGQRINAQVMNSRRMRSNIAVDHLTIEETQEELKKLDETWEEKKQEAIKQKKDKLLELHPNDIIGDEPATIKKRKKVLQTIKRNQHRQWTFNKLSKEVGKGVKNSLKKMQTQDESGRIIKEVQDRQMMEKKLQDKIRNIFDKHLHLKLTRIKFTII